MITVNGTAINPTLFPDGTSQVWKIPEEILKLKKVSVKWDFTDEREFMHLAQLKNLLDTYLVEASLTMTYLPYGRQDKSIGNNSTYALISFSRLLNSLQFTRVFVLDAHSYVAKELINNFQNIPPHEYVYKLRDLLKPDHYCYPDKGAVEKYAGTLGHVYLYGDKLRDQYTGNILKYNLIGNPQDQKILIIDDICDGGATFVVLAKSLYNAGAKEVNLFVTHGIFSKGLTPLTDAGIKRIFTKDGEAVGQDKIMQTIIYKPYEKEA